MYVYKLVQDEILLCMYHAAFTCRYMLYIYWEHSILRNIPEPFTVDFSWHITHASFTITFRLKCLWLSISVWHFDIKLVLYSSVGVVAHYGPRGDHCSTNRAEYPAFCASLDSRTAKDADLVVSAIAGHACCMCGFTEEDTRFLVQTACDGYTTPGLTQCDTNSRCHRISSTYCVHNICKYLIDITNFFRMSLYNISTMQSIFYQFKRDVAVCSETGGK